MSFVVWGECMRLRQSRSQWVTTISETMPRLFRSNKVGWGAKDLLLLETFFGDVVLALRRVYVFTILILKYRYCNIAMVKEFWGNVFKYVYGCRYLNGGTENA